MDSTAICFIIVAAIVTIVIVRMTSEKFTSMIVTDKRLPLTNPYVEMCGPCLPTDNNPDQWEQQCVVKNAQGYNLDYYTMTKRCSTCVDLPDGVKSCSTYVHPGNRFMGTKTYKKGNPFCV
jgi:hypothetical protein